MQVNEIILLGDFIFCNINPDDRKTRRNIEQDSIDTIQDNFLAQDIDLATRGDNIVDLVFTSDLTTISCCEPLSPHIPTPTTKLPWSRYKSHKKAKSM